MLPRVPHLLSTGPLTLLPIAKGTELGARMCAHAAVGILLVPPGGQTLQMALTARRPTHLRNGGEETSVYEVTSVY